MIQVKGYVRRDKLAVLPRNFLGFIFLFLSMSCLSVQAQGSNAPVASGEQTATSESYVLEKGMNEFGIWGGGSPNSPMLIGTTKGARFVIVGMRYARVLAASKRIAFEYTLDLIPLVITSQSPSVFTTDSTSEARRSIYGAGLSPIGFQLDFRRRKRVKPFIGTSGGFLYFKDSVPDNRGTQFNFAFDLGGGVQVFTRSRHIFTVGYKFHHFSNANNGQINPGFDANIFYLGFSVIK